MIWEATDTELTQSLPLHFEIFTWLPQLLVKLNCSLNLRVTRLLEAFSRVTSWLRLSGETASQRGRHRLGGDRLLDLLRLHGRLDLIGEYLGDIRPLGESDLDPEWDLCLPLDQALGLVTAGDGERRGGDSVTGDFSIIDIVLFSLLV